jgi:hypothetical protein
MKEPFPHDIRAVLAAPGKGLALKKIFVSSLFLLLGYLVYLFFTYVALLYDGVSFEYIWQSYGMFPIKLFAFDAPVALVIQLIGIGLTLFCVSLAIMAGAAINFEEIRGDYFFSAFDAIRLTVNRIPTLFLGYLSIAAFIVFVYLLGIVVGLVTRIPYIGELLLGVFYIVPVFITLAFTVFIIFVAIVGIVLFPIVVAAQKQKEVFDGLLQLFSVMIREPVRFIWYTAVTVVFAKVASFILAYLFYRTLQFSRVVLKTGGGGRIEEMFNSAYAMLPLDSPVVAFVTNVFPGISFGFSLVRWGYGGEQSAGSVLLAVSFFLLFIVILGYAASVISAGLARGYAVIRRMKDDYLIVEEEPLLSREDYANPPLANEQNEES